MPKRKNKAKTPGRPPLPKAERKLKVSYTLHPEILSLVEEHAAKLGISHSLFVEQALRCYLLNQCAFKI